jgi:hypothetical protein
MRKNKPPVEQPQPVIFADSPPAQPAQVEDWRYAPKPPAIDPATGEPITGVAEDWRMDPATLPWFVMRCSHCNDAMATRSLKRDVCERCGYEIRDAFYEARRAQIRRAENQLVNPFTSRDPLHELGGSLPSVGGPSRRR